MTGSENISKATKNRFPDDGGQALCGNYAVNTLLQFFRQRAEQSSIEFSVEAPVRLEDGAYVSSKRSGNKTAGIGLESVGNIAEQYDGMMETEYSGGCFRVSVILNTED